MVPPEEEGSVDLCDGKVFAFMGCKLKVAITTDRSTDDLTNGSTNVSNVALTFRRVDTSECSDWRGWRWNRWNGTLVLQDAWTMQEIATCHVGSDREFSKAQMRVDPRDDATFFLRPETPDEERVREEQDYRDARREEEDYDSDARAEEEAEMRKYDW